MKLEKKRPFCIASNVWELVSTLNEQSICKGKDCEIKVGESDLKNCDNCRIKDCQGAESY